MNFIYKIENYYPYESRLFVIYTPVDTNFEPMGGWVNISATMTEAEIEAAVIQQAPYYHWEVAHSPVAKLLEGRTGQGEKPAPIVPTVEETAALAREVATQNRAAAVKAITITTSAGHTFDGDETSQTRMARAILALQGTNTPSTLWVLADNTAIQVTIAELIEALALSGVAQSALWVLPV